MTKTKEFPMKRAPALRRAFYILDRNLEKNAPVDNREKIDLVGRQLFGRLWKPRDQSNQNSES